MKDSRDPLILGSELLRLRHDFEKRPLSALYDIHRSVLYYIPEYDPEEGPISKYGRPQDIPSTLPN